MERQTSNDAFGSRDTSIEVSNGGKNREEGFAAVDMGDSDRDPKDILGERPKRQEADPEVQSVSNTYAEPGGEEGDEDYDDEDDDLELDDDIEVDTDAAAATDDVDVDIEKDLDDEDLSDDDLLAVDDEDDEEDDKL